MSAAAPVASTVPRLRFLERFYAEAAERQAAEEGLARNVVARLKNDVEVEILSQEAYAALPAAERSVESSGSEAQTGTFRTLAALGFKHVEVETYLNALGGEHPAASGRVQALPSVASDGRLGEHPLDIFTIVHFHSRVTFALQTFGLSPVQRSNAAPL